MTVAKLPFTGGCLCGAIRYECSAEPVMMFKCHCRDCQRVTGGGFVPGLLVPVSAFRLTQGQLRYHFTPSLASGTPELPVTGLKVRLGLEKHFPVLARSDHAPFWAEEIPALMWTDTSEFRNHNYHRHTDTPDTLDYAFLRNVTQLLTASVIEQARSV